MIEERDCQLVVMGPFGRVDLWHVTQFETRVDNSSNGWEGAFNLERGSEVVDDFIARIEAAYNDGGAVPSVTLYQYIRENDGSISTYQYDGVVFRLALVGRASQQRVKFFARGRRLIK